MDQVLLEVVRTRELAVKAEQAAKRKTLAVECVEGTLSDPDVIVSRMLDIGIGAEELQEQMTAYTRRVELAADVAAGAGADMAIVANRVKIAQLQAAWEVVFNQHQYDAAVLNNETQRLAQLISTSDSAKRALVDTAGPDVRAKLESLHKASNVAQAELIELERAERDHSSTYLANKELADAGQLERSGAESLPGSWQRLLLKREGVTAKKQELLELIRQVTEIMNGEALLPESF